MSFPRPPPLQIGALRIERPVFLAPMAGYTDAAFRSICREMGAGAVVTEMVNAYGLMIGHVRTRHYLDVFPGEAPVGAQIYGSDPEVMAVAAARVAEIGGFAFLDINAGCPMPKIRARGDGAGLVRTPDLLVRIVRACKTALAGALPLTVKTRIAYTPEEISVPAAVDYALRIQDAGADALFLHGRPATLRHEGPPHWDVLAAVKSALSIPFIANGGAKRTVDVFHMLAETAADGAMVGRAAIGDPWFFARLDPLADGKTVPTPTPDEVFAVIQDHLAREIRLLSLRGPKELKLGVETTACLVMRPHLVRYLRRFRALSTLSRRLQDRLDPEMLLGLVRQVLDSGRRSDTP